jgi:hypothetical protein
MNSPSFILEHHSHSTTINPLDGLGEQTMPLNQYRISICESGITTTWGGNTSFSNSIFFQMLEFKTKKEFLYLTAIDNLLKKTDFLQLTMQLDNDLISNEEFEEELDKNESRYLIKTNQEFDSYDFIIVRQILSDLNRNFTHTDASELFSIPVEKVHDFIDLLNEENQ